MKKYILSLLFLFVFSCGWADEVVTLKDGKTVIIKDNGTWHYVNINSNEEKGGYAEINLVDLKLDFHTLAGKKIKTQGMAQFFSDMLMLKQEMMDMNPLFIDYNKISRDERKYILTSCSTGCTMTVYGQVGNVNFQKGIIADKIEW